MKKIKLTKGQYAIVDDEDFEYLNQWKWFCNSNGYAQRSQHIRLDIGKYKTKKIRMHRIVNKTPDGMETHHINSNKLDNRKENLKTVTSSQNKWENEAPSNNTSGYKGIYWNKSRSKWQVNIGVFRKRLYVGRFNNIKEAVKARKEAETKYHTYET